MKNNKTKSKKSVVTEAASVAVMCRFTQDEIDYMKSVTLATAAATAVNIYARKHILADKNGRVS